MAEYEMIPAGVRVSGAVRGLSKRWGGGTRLPLVGATVLLLYRLKTSNTSSERMHCANALKTGSSHSSLTTKPSARTSMEFLAEITSLAVDDTNSVRYRCNNMIRHLLIKLRWATAQKKKNLTLFRHVSG